MIHNGVTMIMQNDIYNKTLKIKRFCHEVRETESIIRQGLSHFSCCTIPLHSPHHFFICKPTGTLPTLDIGG